MSRIIWFVTKMRKMGLDERILSKKLIYDVIYPLFFINRKLFLQRSPKTGTGVPSHTRTANTRFRTAHSDQVEIVD